MTETAAHLADRVIPPVPVRQWAISVPKCSRGFFDTAADMLAWDNSGFSIDATVRVGPLSRDVPSYFRESLERLSLHAGRGPPTGWAEFVQVQDDRDAATR